MKTSLLRILESDHTIIKYIALVKKVKHVVIFEEMLKAYLEDNKIEIPENLLD